MAYANNRIFYACQAVIIVPTMGEDMATKGVPVRGLQSVGMSSTFNLEQVFEMGQIEIYENIEEVADVEVTLEKVIDGRALIYQLASNGACATNITDAAKNRCDVYLAIFTDTVDSVGQAGATKTNVCYNSGMYTSSVSYNYSIDGSATESVTLVGNDRFWNDQTIEGTSVTASSLFSSAAVNGIIDNTDTPLSGVQRRVDVDLREPGAGGSTLPREVKFQQVASNAGTNAGAHIQSISVSTDFAQDNILELGRFGPYARYATFPVEVTSEFEVIATSGDLVSVSGSTRNLGAGQPIIIKDSAGTVINLGSNNKLTSVSYSGGDTGGGNATITYSYNTYNSLFVDGGDATDDGKGTNTGSGTTPGAR
jgi:hypothetical protein